MALANQPVSLLGLGAMGSALTSALLKHAPGPQVTVWNRTATRPAIHNLVASGATFEASLDAAIATAPTIIVCLISYSAIYSALEPVGPDALKGKTIVNLTNGTPAESRAMAAHMRSHHGVAAYLDVAVMATPSMVGTPASQIFLSGDTTAQTLEPLTPLITLLGAPTDFGPDPGAASVQDLANLATMYGLFCGTLTALALVKVHGGDNVDKTPGTSRRLGPSLPAVQNYIRPTLAAILPLTDHLAHEWDEGIEAGGPHPLGMQLVALENILRACAEAGVDAGGLKHLTGKVKEAVGECGAEKSFTVVARKFLVD